MLHFTSGRKNFMPTVPVNTDDEETQQQQPTSDTVQQVKSDKAITADAIVVPKQQESNATK